jgi:hypothetical protein
LFDFNEIDLVGKELRSLIPGAPQDATVESISHASFLTGRGYQNNTFPIMITKSNENDNLNSSQESTFNPLKLCLVSLLNISGVLVMTNTGNIHSINSVCAKHLFGKNSESLINTDIVLLIPKIWEHYKQLSVHPSVLRTSLTNKLKRSLSSYSSLSDLSLASITQLQVLHNDGTLLNVSVTMKPNNGLLVLCITFKRDDVQDPSIIESDGTPPSRPMQRRQTAPAESLNYEKKKSFHSELPLSNRNTTIDCYQILKKLGEGTYGFVRLASHKNDPEHIPVVIKYILKSTVLRWIRRPSIGGRVPVELAILNDLTLIPHRSIPRLLTSFQDEFYNYIVMPYHSSHDLFDWIENNNNPLEDNLKYIFSQILSAVNHLHFNDIVHRDIKVLIFKYIG